MRKITIYRGRVSAIIVFNDSVCRTFYDIDGTVLGLPLPGRLRAVLQALLLLIPHRIQVALEALLPLKSRIDRVLLVPKTKCFLSARTTKSTAITIRELKSRFKDISVLVLRLPHITIHDFYRHVALDILYTLGTVPDLILLG